MQESGVKNDVRQQKREELERLLAVLKRNREKVPLDVLKTKYKKGYDVLCCQISQAASEYAAMVVFGGISVRRDHWEEVSSYVSDTMKESGMLKQLSQAAFSHQDLEEFDRIAEDLRKKVIAELRMEPSMMVIVTPGVL